VQLIKGRMILDGFKCPAAIEVLAKILNKTGRDKEIADRM